MHLFNSSPDCSRLLSSALASQTNLMIHCMQGTFVCIEYLQGFYFRKKNQQCFYIIKCYWRFQFINFHPDVDHYLQPVRMADMDELFGSDGDSDNEQRGTLDLHYCIDEWRCVSFMC